ncbi:unnamed protein product [Rotaria magnacalcarata]|uniref:Peptidase C1A papain C-terminal domain-containing protein n=1 Tax=Rotaria magnacalcarata TaxID=392030 RepID=A0A816L5M6_9BILA|nr:unnamed protein product [Rotaria magnacalcarata]
MAQAEAEAKYLINSETGDRFKIGGCLISDTPSNLPLFGAARTLSNKQLPPATDLRQFMTLVEHQQNTNSCVANALAGAYEFLIKKNTKKHVDVSRLFIYYNGRTLDNIHTYQMNDNGTYIYAAIEGLKKYGCCKEEIHLFNEAIINQKPSQQCFTEGAKHRIKDAFQVRVDLNEMKGCLAEGFPFVFGLSLFQSFAQAQTNGGRVPTPNPTFEPKSASHGSHAMLAVGYSDQSQCFIVRNSWGTEWGDNGYCYISYQYLANPELCSDIHCIRLIEDEPGRRRDTDIVNPYDWNVHKDKSNPIPPNYIYPNFDYTFFWKLNDQFNYFKNIYNGGTIVPFVWGQSYTDHNNHHANHIVTPNNEVPTIFVVWIDKITNANMSIVKTMTSGNDIKFDFYETLSSAEEHVLRLKHKIKSSSNFQIICRGYYRDENKNPLDLLKFLNANELSHVPVVVFTKDKNGLISHLEKQAPSMDIRDWDHRLFITSSSQELITKVKEKKHHKYGH